MLAKPGRSMTEGCIGGNGRDRGSTGRGGQPFGEFRISSELGGVVRGGAFVAGGLGDRVAGYRKAGVKIAGASDRDHRLDSERGEELDGNGGTRCTGPACADDADRSREFADPTEGMGRARPPSALWQKRLIEYEDHGRAKCEVEAGRSLERRGTKERFLITHGAVCG